MNDREIWRTMGMHPPVSHVRGRWVVPGQAKAVDMAAMFVVRTVIEGMCRSWRKFPWTTVGEDEENGDRQRRGAKAERGYGEWGRPRWVPGGNVDHGKRE
jgi:hypothetical protein